MSDRNFVQLEFCLVVRYGESSCESESEQTTVLTNVLDHDPLELINLSLDLFHLVWLHLICDISLE